MDDPSPPPENPAVAGSPSDFLKNIVGKKVKVRIGNGLDYHGEPLVLDIARSARRELLRKRCAFVTVHSSGDGTAWPSIKETSILTRSDRPPHMFGWLHECRVGRNGRMGGRTDDSAVWGLLFAWEQR